jgi:opacity protein-like surface antigen
MLKIIKFTILQCLFISSIHAVLPTLPKAHLGRTEVAASVGLAKYKYETFGVDIIDLDGFGLGLENNFAVIKNPSLFGFDISVGYKFFNYDLSLSHDFEQLAQQLDLDLSEIGVSESATHGICIAGSPYLYVNQYFKPYITTGLGFSRIDGESDTSFLFGAGFETEIIENWSSRLGYEHAFYDPDVRTFTFDTGYIFENGFIFGIDYQFRTFRINERFLDIELPLKSSGHILMINSGYSF